MFVISDRIKETSTTTGTGTITLAGAVTGFSSFSAIGDANTCTYALIGVDANGVPTGEWETGIGTYTSSGTTLSRGVIKSSNANALVSFSAGTKHVICTDVAGYSTPLVMTTVTNRAIQVADQGANSSTAGDERGRGSVDLQIKRTSATQVASGIYSTISGGRANTAGGNAYAVVSGGRSNIASGTSSTVAGGRANTASGNYGSVAGGYTNVSSGAASSVSGGMYNTASGTYSVVNGGRSNTASGSYSCATGKRAKADKYGQVAVAAGDVAAQGDAQSSTFVLRKQTTDNTQAEMFLDGSSARMTLSNDTSWVVTGFIVARNTGTDSESSCWKFEGFISRNTNAASTAIGTTITPTNLHADMNAITWAVDVTADTTNGSLRLRVTGETSKTINWVASLWTTEVTG